MFKLENYEIFTIKSHFSIILSLSKLFSLKFYLPTKEDLCNSIAEKPKKKLLHYSILVYLHIE